MRKEGSLTKPLMLTQRLPSTSKQMGLMENLQKLSFFIAINTEKTFISSHYLAKYSSVFEFDADRNILLCLHINCQNQKH
jgi:hypothetical protein